MNEFMQALSDHWAITLVLCFTLVCLVGLVTDGLRRR